MAKHEHYSYVNVYKLTFRVPILSVGRSLTVVRRCHLRASFEGDIRVNKQGQVRSTLGEWLASQSIDHAPPSTVLSMIRKLEETSEGIHRRFNMRGKLRITEVLGGVEIWMSER